MYKLLCIILLTYTITLKTSLTSRIKYHTEQIKTKL